MSSFCWDRVIEHFPSFSFKGLCPSYPHILRHQYNRRLRPKLEKKKREGHHMIFVVIVSRLWDCDSSLLLSWKSLKTLPQGDIRFTRHLNEGPDWEGCLESQVCRQSFFIIMMKILICSWMWFTWGFLIFDLYWIPLTSVIQQLNYIYDMLILGDQLSDVCWHRSSQVNSVNTHFNWTRESS